MSPQIAAGLRRFAVCRSGATAVEYGLIAALIAAALIAALSPVGNMLTSWFNISVAVIEAVPD